MIKAKKGKCKIEGKGIEILAEFCGIVNGLKAAGVPERWIDRCVELGKLGPEELAKKGNDIWEAIEKDFADAL